MYDDGRTAMPVASFPEDALNVPFAPMLATAGSLPDDATRWAHELKWDGVRVVARVVDGRVRLTSRNGNDVTAAYPELAELGSLVHGPAILDGELVALDPEARPSFELLQRRMHVTDAARLKRVQAAVPVAYLVFDLCLEPRRWLLEQPYAARRAALAELAPVGEHVAVPQPLDEAGRPALELAAACGAEGVVAKRLDSPYRPGTRSACWIKAKLLDTVEVVVCGFVGGSGGRSTRLGALVVGVPGPAGLEYAGRVGTGFTERVLDDLARRLAPMRIAAHPFAEPPDERLDGACWVRPELVGEVSFQRWTASGKLRAPAWRGLRHDLDPAGLATPPGRRR